MPATIRSAAVVLPELVSESDRRYTLERFSVKEAAGYLSIDQAKVYRLVAAKAIGCRRDGPRRVLFSQADLDAWREARRETPKAAAPALQAVGAGGLAPLPRIVNPKFSGRRSR